jgi:hypothetical protein
VRRAGRHHERVVRQPHVRPSGANADTT